MSQETAKSLLMASPFEIQQAGFYQALLKGISSHEQLGNRLIRSAEHAHAFRQFDKVRELGQVLFNFPLKRFAPIGAYFIGVALNSCGNGDQDKAKRMFERVVDTAPDEYKAKALLSLAAVSFNTKAYDAALHFYRETTKAAPVSSSSLHAIRTIAIIKSIEGQHHAALKDLESLYPLSRQAAPHVYFDYLNSLAVELNEVGRKDEARNIMRVVLASPFISAYPEWRETAEDLRPSRRSFVALNSTHYNILSLPEREPSGEPSAQPVPARVFNFAKLKQKIVKEKQDKNLAKQLDGMSHRDLGFKLLEIIAQYRPNKSQMRAIIDFALSLLGGPDEPDEKEHGPDKPAS